MQNLKDFIILLKYGLFGFLAFFVILISAKFLASIIFEGSKFNIEIGDFLLSTLGFIYLIFVQLIKEIKKGEDLEKN